MVQAWAHRSFKALDTPAPRRLKPTDFPLHPSELRSDHGLAGACLVGRGDRDDVQRTRAALNFPIPRACDPERCPRCSASGWNRDRGTFFRGEVRSVIRAHTSGVSLATQALTDRLIDELGSQGSRTIVFTDSRDDAATTAAGLELNHFRDLIRQLISRELHATVSPGQLLRLAAEEPDADGASTQSPSSANTPTFGQLSCWTREVSRPSRIVWSSMTSSAVPDQLQG